MASDLTARWRDTFNKASATFSKDVESAADSLPKKDAEDLKSLFDGPLKQAEPLVDRIVAFEELALGEYKEKGRGRFYEKVSAAKAALAKLEGATKSYAGHLDDMRSRKFPSGDKTVPLKRFLPDSYRQLRILKAEAEAILALARNNLDAFLKKGQIAALSAEGKKRKAKVKGQDDASKGRRDEISREFAMKQFVLGFSARFRSSMAKGAAVIQKIKASPDVETYNREMADGGRDISQNVGNVQKLKAHPKFRDTKLAKSLKDPAEIMERLERYGNGDRQSLKQDADAKAVQEALKEFIEVYKLIAAAYGDLLAGKA